MTIFHSGDRVRVKSKKELLSSLSPSALNGIDRYECDGYFELGPTFTVKVTKQYRKRDKKKKDDKRRDYSKYSYSPSSPRTKGDSEYVLPARRSKWKKFLKTKSNRTVRRHKGYLPKGNGYRKMDDDLWIWW